MDLIAHLYRQRAFSKATFGPGPRVAGVTDHIEKELLEIRELAEGDLNDQVSRNKLLYEFIDIVLLGLDGAWRAGYQPEDIARALELKQGCNETREWPDWRTAPKDKAIEHVKG